MAPSGTDGLSELLASLNLQGREAAARSFCATEGVVHISMIAEADAHDHASVDRFISAIDMKLPLTQVQRGAVRDRLYLCREGMRKRLVSQLGLDTDPEVTELRRQLASAEERADRLAVFTENLARIADLQDSEPPGGR